MNFNKELLKDDVREMQMDDRCPHIKRVGYKGESADMCELVNKWCLVEHGQYECEIWNEIKGEKK